jgi:plasmid stabilization system protein ParE
MNRYKISQLAEQDLEDIWVYLAQNNQIAADKQIANRSHINVSKWKAIAQQLL